MNSFVASACALLYMLVFASRVLSKTKYLVSMFQWLQFRHHAGWATLHEISNTLRIILYRVYTSFRKGIHIQMQCRSDTEEVGRSLAVARSKSQPSSEKTCTTIVSGDLKVLEVHNGCETLEKVYPPRIKASTIPNAIFLCC
jgi:hypothetical protein